MRLGDFLFYIFMASLIYFACLGIWYTILLIVSFPEVFRKFRETQYDNILSLIEKEHIIPISVVIPIFNEEKRMRFMETIYSLLNSHYKNINIIIVNDGSTDNTMEILKTNLALYETKMVIRKRVPTEKVRHYYQSERFPNILVFDKEHSPYNCSADSLNAGLNACKTPLMISMDADTVVEPEAISRILLAFLSAKHCVAVSASIYVLNELEVEKGVITEIKLPKKFLPALQAVEYLRSFLYGRAGLNVFGGALCYPGAFTLFDTQVLRDLGGYDKVNYGSDAEVTMAFHHWMRKNHYPYNMNHSPNAFCWTEVPDSYQSYWAQRDKWHRGMLRASQRHREMFFNPNYGVVGLLTFPSYFLFEIMGPVVEFISYLMFAIGLFIGTLTFDVIIWFVLLAWGYITFITIAMIFLNLISFNKYYKFSEVIRMIYLVFAEMCWIRQYRALCCSFATCRYLWNRLLGFPL